MHTYAHKFLTSLGADIHMHLTTASSTLLGYTRNMLSPWPNTIYCHGTRWEMTGICSSWAASQHFITPSTNSAASVSSRLQWQQSLPVFVRHSLQNKTPSLHPFVLLSTTIAGCHERKGLTVLAPHCGRTGARWSSRGCSGGGIPLVVYV